jgi:hypothetical protein
MKPGTDCPAISEMTDIYNRAMVPLITPEVLNYRPKSVRNGRAFHKTVPDEGAGLFYPARTSE